MLLDDFMPAWHFRERHSLRVVAAPATVFEAIRQVRADEIFLFRTLTWIRRAGRPMPAGILNPDPGEPLISVALRGGFIELAEDPDRELVLGTAVATPRDSRVALTPQAFRGSLPDGYVLAAMNFLVTPLGPAESHVSTETRVYANTAKGRSRFAVYWAMIYPGSALIRRMWLRAIRRRALAPAAVTG